MPLKIRIGVDADTGQSIAAQLTTSDVDDSSHVRPILDLVTRPITSFTGGSVDDRNRVCGGVGRHAAVVIAQRRLTAVPRCFERHFGSSRSPLTGELKAAARPRPARGTKSRLRSALVR